jgi:4-hydroxy-3-methylbut-2-en-1-yl diphosphate reductase
MKSSIEIVRPTTNSICDLRIRPVPQEPGVDYLFLANETGPCGGVEMAERVLDELIAYRDQQGADSGETLGIYGNHPPSKGADRAQLYRQAGVSFDVPIGEIPRGSIYLFSAHGADPSEVEKAERAGLNVVDTTCPLVGHIYRQIERETRNHSDVPPDEIGVVYLAGEDMRHPEVVGTRGVARKAGTRFIPITSEKEAVALADGQEQVGPEQMSLRGLRRVMVTGLTTNNSKVTQRVALSFQDRVRDNGGYPDDFIQPYSARSVCGTVRHRQEAVREMVRREVQTLIVVGALDSHNTKKLVAAAIDEAEGQALGELALRRIFYANTYMGLPTITGKVGVVSGASTQQPNIDQIVARLNPPDGCTESLGDTDKAEMFLPMGGPNSTARRTLLGDFKWLNNNNKQIV